MYLSRIVRGPFPLNLNSNSFRPAVAIGKYQVSSLSKQLDDGGYRASVSIRSGRGSATTDRVMRFTDRFESERAAHHYAHEQGLMWVARTGQPA